MVDARRNYGEGGLSWNESRRRWVGRVSVGYAPNGKRRIATVSAKTKTEAKEKLQNVVRAHADGLPIAHRRYTVGEAVESWLANGLVGRDASTVANRTSLARSHVIPELGRGRLVELSAEDVEALLSVKAATLSTDTVRRLLSILRQSIRRAESRELVGRNVAALVDAPRGTAGRPSKSLTFAQAEQLVAAAREDRGMRAYVVVSLFTGARTEELRALTWAHVDLVGDDDARPAVPPTVSLWRSVRTGGETKTRTSRRTLELPQRCVDALRAHRVEQARARVRAGERWVETDLVFANRSGTALDAANVRRAFRRVAEAAGLDPAVWTPRELRHSFVSLLSSAGVSIEDISHLVGHASTKVTELVYRKELRPVLRRGAIAMDELFPVPAGDEDGKQIGKQAGE